MRTIECHGQSRVFLSLWSRGAHPGNDPNLDKDLGGDVRIVLGNRHGKGNEDDAAPFGGGGSLKMCPGESPLEVRVAARGSLTQGWAVA